MTISTPVQKVAVELDKLFILLSILHYFEFVAAQQSVLS